MRLNPLQGGENAIVTAQERQEAAYRIIGCDFGCFRFRRQCAGGGNRPKRRTEEHQPGRTRWPATPRLPSPPRRRFPPLNNHPLPPPPTHPPRPTPPPPSPAHRHH